MLHPIDDGGVARLVEQGVTLVAVQPEGVRQLEGRLTGREVVLPAGLGPFGVADGGEVQSNQSSEIGLGKLRSDPELSEVDGEGSVRHVVR